MIAGLEVYCFVLVLCLSRDFLGLIVRCCHRGLGLMNISRQILTNAEGPPAYLKLSALPECTRASGC